MSQDYNEVATPGGRVGARIAKLVSDATVHTRQRLAQTQSEMAKEVFTSVTNEISDEVRGALGPLFRRIAEHPKLDPELAPLFHHLANTRGQAFGWVGGQVAGAGITGGLGELFSWMLENVVQSIIETEPTGRITPEQAAMAGARGFLSEADAAREARRGDIDQHRFDALTELNRSRPSPPDIGTLLNRGVVDEPGARALMRALGFGPSDVEHMLTLAKVPLTPQEAAQAWARNLVSAELVRFAARAQGLTNEDADVLMGLAGEPPDTTSAILAWRRGIITEEDVDRAIVQGPIRNEWIPVIKALQEEPLPPTEAASAVVQGHLSAAQGQAKAALSGISAEDFRVITENSGIPPGIEFAAEAVNRGLLSEDDWEAMFLESRIKNKYIPLMRAMRENLPPAETARIAYRLGVASRDWALDILAGHGFSRPNAEVMLNLEDARAREGTKDLTRAQVIDLFEDGIIEEEQAAAMLAELGYDQIEVGWQMALAQGRVVKRFVNALVTRVRAAYVSGVMDAETAATTLDQAGVGPVQRDQLLAIWDLEKEALSASLTAAQIVSAVKKGFLDRGEGMSRLVAKGYTEEDADILIKLSVGA